MPIRILPSTISRTTSSCSSLNPKFEKVNISYPGVTKSENSTYYFVPSYTDAIESLRKYR